MKNYLSVHDVKDLDLLVKEALKLKDKPFKHDKIGKHKTLGLIFMNPSLRTRLSTQRAAQNLGMNVMVMNVGADGWVLETKEGAIMNGTTVEHIKEAAPVMSQYCDIIGIRCFPNLKNREEDYSEDFLNKFIQYSSVPVISLESATRHPLQSLADLITIRENTPKKHLPKVVLTWAPHIKALPQCVANSFSEWMCRADVDFTVVHPEGLELAHEFTKGAVIRHDQQAALKDADFVYVKNWSSYKDYGKIHEGSHDWMLTQAHLKNTNNAKVMHCLPVRRNLELSDEILDSPSALVIQQANNRLWAAQAVLKTILEDNF
jgi:N-succinyl-L-ornithine transcarbamylase